LFFFIFNFWIFSHFLFFCFFVFVFLFFCFFGLSKCANNKNHNFSIAIFWRINDDAICQPFWDAVFGCRSLWSTHLPWYFYHWMLQEGFQFFFFFSFFLFFAHIHDTFNCRIAGKSRGNEKKFVFRCWLIKWQLQNTTSMAQEKLEGNKFKNSSKNLWTSIILHLKGIKKKARKTEAKINTKNQ